jgi:hypothetical protein
LQGLAEGFSQAGVPVFIADVKGDLSGLAASGVLINRRWLSALNLIEFPMSYQPCPVIFWDVFGKNGHPVRTTVSEMGPLMLARLLELNDTQEGVLEYSLRCCRCRRIVTSGHGRPAGNTHPYQRKRARLFLLNTAIFRLRLLAAIQRALLTLEAQGGKHLYSANLHYPLRTLCRLHQMGMAQ